MREYEFTFVVQPEITDDGLQGLCEKLEGTLERAGGTRLFYEDWGRRRLAYEIQKFQKGHYLVMHYLDEGQCVPEVERTARLEDSVLRFLTVVANERVTDIDARKAEAVVFEDERKQKAAERAEREAEEAAARAAEAEEAAARAAEASAAAAAAAEEQKPEAETEAAATEAAAEPASEPAATEAAAEPASEPAATEAAAEPASEPAATEAAAEPASEATATEAAGESAAETPEAQDGKEGSA